MSARLQCGGPNILPWGARYLVDAHRPAQDYADWSGVAMTVFYHPDHAFNFTDATAPLLRRKPTELFVTWLPKHYFN